jgi:hypothetical protein
MGFGINIQAGKCNAKRGRRDGDEVYEIGEGWARLVPNLNAYLGMKEIKSARCLAMMGTKRAGKSNSAGFLTYGKFVLFFKGLEKRLSSRRRFPGVVRLFSASARPKRHGRFTATR